jgi:uncharacterized protein YajQ (UPF0234 family)
MKNFGIGVLIVFAFLLLGVIGFGVKSCSIAEKHVTNSMDNAVITYDDYQDIYNTCIQLNNDLKVIKDTPDSDSQFTQFSKAQRVNAIKQNLNRWIAEYNAKSKHIDKKWWKSNTLPQELTTNLFSNY